MKNFPHFLSEIFSVFLFSNLWVKTKKIDTFTFFINAYIFSDRRLKNHKIFIFHLLSIFLEIL
jgi:hypothetical protein